MNNILLAVLCLTALPAYADDACVLPEYQKKISGVRAQLHAAEASGNRSKAYSIHKKMLNEECATPADIAKAKKAIVQIGSAFGKTAENTGNLVKETAFSAATSDSAFHWYEESGLFADAERVLAKAIHQKPTDIALYKFTLNHENSGDREREKFKRQDAFKSELKKIAEKNATDNLNAEDKMAANFAAPFTQLQQTAMESKIKLQTAAMWLAFLPAGDKAAKVRAEKRGDTVAARPDVALTASIAESFYQFAGSPKAEKMRQRSNEAQKNFEKAGNKMNKVVKEKNTNEEKTFQKGTDDLEEELGM